MPRELQQAATFTTQVTRTITLHYLVYLPDAYSTNEQRWPLVLFLHGAGERGADLELLKRHGPPKLIAQGKRFPFILVSPQCPEGEYWSVELLAVFLDDVQNRYHVDPARIYLTGISMGGHGVWELAMAYPDLFAAVVPICGWGRAKAVCTLKHIPVWVFHGKKDRVVPVEASEAMAGTLKACGGSVRLTIYPEAGHDAWTATYNNPALFRWLLKQKRVTRQE